MNKQTISNSLTTGLLAGYGGQTKFTSVSRGSFELTASHFETGGIVYHDEWTNNGGQEIVQVGNDTFTRVYAGGMAESQTLADLNITPDEVISQLISKINELKGKTRLFADYFEESKSDWGYEYKVIDKDEHIMVTTGKEIISFKGKIVFIHVFVLSPVTK